MVYVVKVSDKKKIHSSRTDPKKLGADHVHTELSVVAQHLLESSNPETQIVQGNVGIFLAMVLQRFVGTRLARFGPAPQTAFGSLIPAPPADSL